MGLDGTREYLTKVGANASGSPGMKHEITHYKNNKKYGFSELYFTVDKNAVLEMRGCFVNDKKHGLCEVFHSNGKVQIRENFLEDVPHGLQEVFNDEGQLMERSEYLNGQLQKRETEF